MRLTYENYHSPEANAQYMSVSDFKDWMRCPARKAALQREDMTAEYKEAFALGSYFDTALLTPERLPDLLENEPDTYTTKKGDKRAFVQLADAMVTRAKRDLFFMAACSGEPQRIITFDLFGHKWKAMLDVTNLERGFFTDVKTVRSIDDLEWSDEHKARVPFYEVYNYWLQLAVYREAYKSVAGDYPRSCYLAAVSKQNPPDIRIIEFAEEVRFNNELKYVAENIDRVAAMKAGRMGRTRCERCDYCRGSRVLRAAELAVSYKVGTITEEEFMMEGSI